MREFQARKKQQAEINRVLGSKWFLIFMLIIIIFLIRGNVRIFRNYFKVQDKYHKDLKSLEDLRQRDEKLNHDLDRINTEAGLDYEIRKKLDVSAPDEKVIKIIDKK